MAPRRRINNSESPRVSPHRRRQRRIARGKFLESNKKKRLLACEGFLYTVNLSRPEANTINWKCVQTCCGTAKTEYFDLKTVPINTEVDVTLMKDHTHGRDDVAIEVREVVTEIKRRERSQPNSSPAEIIRDVTSTVERNEVLQRLPERQTIMRSLHRAQNIRRPAIPRTLDEVLINGPYALMMNAQQFLQHDIYLADGNRLVIFYSIDDLRRLCLSDAIYLDGTFKTAPRLFYQVSFR